MGCQDGAGPGSGAGNDGSKQVAELREQILQLAGHACHEKEEKLRTELLEKLNVCKRNTLIELCRSFGIVGSRANRKEELVSFLMKFVKDHTSSFDGTNPDTSLLLVADLRQQILQLTLHACHKEEEKSLTELLEKLNVCKRDMLIELCRSFGIVGSRANRKEELVSILTNFVKDHSSGIDGTNPDKKIKKRRHVKEEEKFSSGKPLKKKKQEATALETQGEEEANGRKGLDNTTHYSECDVKDIRYVCADNKKAKFPYEEANLAPSERINGSMSENVVAVPLTGAPIHANEQALITSPSAKVVTTAEVDSTSVKGSKKKHSSITKKKATPKEDHEVKSCGKGESRGDAKPQKRAMRPSRDELREAVILILDATDFATMTFGHVVKEVDRYFGKDLFERKPLIRSLIEEELFRLSEEAEKKEMEEEEAAEAKAQDKKAAMEMAQVRTVELGIDKRNKLEAGEGGTAKDSAKNANGNANEKGEPSDKRNSSDAAQGSQDGKADTNTKNGENGKESTKDGKGEKASPGVNSDDAVQGSGNGNAGIVTNTSVDTLEGCKDGKTKEASNGENDDTEDGSIDKGTSVNGCNNAEDVNDYEAQESKSRANDECVKRAEESEAEEGSNESSSNAMAHGDKDGKAKEGNIDAEQSPTDEDAEHNVNTKVDVDSGKNGAAENGKIDGIVEAESDGEAERSHIL